MDLRSGTLVFCEHQSYRRWISGAEIIIREKVEYSVISGICYWCKWFGKINSLTTPEFSIGIN
jgi:hypothetical protein